MSEAPQDLPQHPTAYTPFRNLPREKFKRLAPYFQYDAESMQGASVLPNRYPRKRQRLEKAFPQIGGAFMVGLAGGGVLGLVEGVISSSHFSRKIHRTHVVNHILKRGRASSNLLGSLALTYCSLGVIFQLIRGRQDDGWNTIAAGGTTGLLFRISDGLRKGVAGACIGLTVSSMHVLWNQSWNVLFW